MNAAPFLTLSNGLLGTVSQHRSNVAAFSNHTPSQYLLVYQKASFLQVGAWQDRVHGLMAVPLQCRRLWVLWLLREEERAEMSRCREMPSRVKTA